MDESIGHTFVSAASTGWEPGHFDAELALDGEAFRPDGKTSAVLVPPAFGLADVNLDTGSWRRGIRYLSCPAALEAAGNDLHPPQDLPRKRSAVQAKAPRSNGLTKRHGRVGSF